MFSFFIQQVVSILWRRKSSQWPLFAGNGLCLPPFLQAPTKQRVYRLFPFTPTHPWTQIPQPLSWPLSALYPMTLSKRVSKANISRASTYRSHMNSFLHSKLKVWVGDESLPFDSGFDSVIFIHSPISLPFPIHIVTFIGSIKHVISFFFF